MLNPRKQHLLCLVAALLALVQRAPAQRPEDEDVALNVPQLIVQLGNVGRVFSIATSADGRFVATGGDEGVLVLWEVETGREIRRFEETLFRQPVTAAAFSTDNRLLLTAGMGDDGRSGAVFQWHLETGRLLAFSTGFPDIVKHLSFSPDASLAAAAGGGSYGVWDVRAGRWLRLEEKNPAGVIAVEISPDNEYIVFGTYEGGAHVRAVRTGEERRRFQFDPRTASALGWSPDGRLTVIRNDGGRRHLGFKSGPGVVRARGGEHAPKEVKDLDRFFGNAGWVLCAEFSRDGRYILTGVQDGDGDEQRDSVHLWDIESGQELRRFKGHDFASQYNSSTAAYSPVAISPDGSLFLTGKEKSGHGGAGGPAESNNAHLYDAVSGRLVRPFIGHTGPVAAVGFSGNGRFVVTGSFDQSARLWDAATGAEVRRFPVGGAVKGVFVSPDNRQVLTLTVGEGSLWDVATGERLVRLERASSSFYSAAFTPDGQFVLAIDRDLVACLWQASTGKIVRRFGESRAVALSPSGRYVLTANSLRQDGKVAQLWDAQTGARLKLFEGHRDRIEYVAFHPKDEGVVMTAGYDGTTRLWDAATARELCRLISFRDGNWVVADSDGRFDANTLEEIQGLHWVMPNERMRTYPLEIFMRAFYEPRLLPRVVRRQPLPETPDLAKLNRAQPRVTITKVRWRKKRPDEVSVEVKIAAPPSGRDADAAEVGVYDLRLFRDGQLVGQVPLDDSAEEPAAQPGRMSDEELLRDWQRRALIRLNKGGEKKITFPRVRLPHNSSAGRVEFSAYAFNSDRVKSATAKLPYDLPAEVRSHLNPVTPRAYLVTFGVNVFQDPLVRPLLYPANDARSVRDALLENLQGRYQVVPVPLIADFEQGSRETVVTPTKGNLRTVLALLAGRRVPPEHLSRLPAEVRDALRPATPDDVVLISFSTHGEADERGDFYLYPFDTGPAIAEGRDYTRLISNRELSLWLRDVDAGELVVILDACHSGAAPGAEFKPGPMGSRGLGQLAYDKGMRILAATQADNIALGDGVNLGGLLTTALVRDGIRKGRAAERDRLTMRAWLEYAVGRVPALYAELPPEQQEGRKVQQPALFDFNRRRSETVLLVNP